MISLWKVGIHIGNLPDIFLSNHYQNTLLKLSSFVNSPLAIYDDQQHRIIETDRNVNELTLSDRSEALQVQNTKCEPIHQQSLFDYFHILQHFNASSQAQNDKLDFCG